MITIIVEKDNGVYTRELNRFKRKGIKYYLFLLKCKILNRKLEILDERRIKGKSKRVRKTNKTKR